MPPAGPVRAFLSYAHEDHEWRDRVLKHIGWLAHTGQLVAFDDRQLRAGERWDERIKHELEAADLIVVLISPDFVGSRYCSVEELLRAVERQEAGRADLVPIVCDFVSLPAPLEPHQCLPQDEANDLKPLCDWPNPNKPLMAIAAKIRALVEARRPPAPAPPVEAAAGQGTPARGIPPRGRFVGRQTDLEQLLAWLLDDAPEPVAVLGPGGIGKSKLTLAGLHHERVATRFGERRLFVRLEDARDEAGVCAALARELGLEPGPHLVNAVTAALRAVPALVVLDNAETPWEADLAAGSAAVEEAFARLTELPGVRLVASLRGFELPGTAAWRPLLVEPLPEDTARALFLDVAGHEGEHYRTDPELPRLLARLDGLPLAIELVALRAQTEPGAAAMLAAWEAERAAFVRAGVGGKKQPDLAASVALSLTSPRMTEPGRRLFAVLGRLPHGLAQADLAAIMPADGVEAARALRRTGLVLRDPARLRMLAPVREQAAAAPLGEAERDALVAHFGALADALPYRGEEPRDRMAARRAREELANIEGALALVPPSTDPARLSDSGWRWGRVGDARQVVGAVRPATEAYSAAHGLFERAVRADPGNAGWQRDLSVSWERLGDVRLAQGDLAGTLEAYQQRHAIAERLAAADPGNAEWQRDLSLSWNKLGDVRRAQGDLAGALEAYQQHHAIAERLAAADPGNAEWQYDLGISHERLGNVLQAQGKLAEAAASHQRRHDIISKLASADPGNAGWQRDLSVSWNKLGDVRRAQGDLAGALEAYTASKGIRERLAAADPGNAGWQRDLIVSHWKLADVLEKMADRQAEAATHWAPALEIARRLADDGRLAPADGYFVEELERRLAAASRAR